MRSDCFSGAPPSPSTQQAPLHLERSQTNSSEKTSVEIILSFISTNININVRLIPFLLREMFYLCVQKYEVYTKRGRKSPLFLGKIDMISKERIEALIDERIQELDKNLYVVEMTISSNNVIRVELDRVDGYVAVEDCMSVSRNIEHNIDREQDDFELHVSSAGLDKPFRHENQYLKNIGKRVKVKLKDTSKIEGELISFDSEEMQLKDRVKKKIEGRKKKEWVEEIYKIKMKEIKDTKIVISFK